MQNGQSWSCKFTLPWLALHAGTRGLCAGKEQHLLILRGALERHISIQMEKNGLGSQRSDEHGLRALISTA